MKARAIFFMAAVSLLVTAMSVGSARSQAVTDDNLAQSIAEAKTPAQHEAIAAYYDQEAAASKEKADLHRRSAATYRKMNIDKPVGMAAMCDNIAATWDKVAADAKKLAGDHHEMAKNAK